jgi:tetratricopeptide (TPR) repeat protein
MTHHRLLLYIPFILIAFLMLTRGKPGFAQNAVSDPWQKNIPRKAAALKEAAKVLIQQHDYQGAVAKLEQSLAFKKDYYLAVYDLAVAYALRGTELQAPSVSDRTRAWRELGKAQTIAETQGIKDAALYTTMGWLASMEAIFSQPEEFARRTTWYAAAQRYWESALNIDAASTVALNNLGALYELQGDFERALEYYAKAKALKDDKGEANHRRLQLLTTRLTSPVASAETRGRRALIIGNGAYADTPLQNPVHDAQAMAETLRRVGFDITIVLNGNRSTIEQAVETFTRGVPRGTVGLFYFAGHGVQINGQNYLIPIGARLQRPVDVQYSAVAADWILRRMDETGMELKVFILDASRVNLFGRSWTRTLDQGLAPMEAPIGSLIVYATEPGRIASDGSGPNSSFTAHLLQEIPIPGRSIEMVFKEVRRRVSAETGGKQIP